MKRETIIFDLDSTLNNLHEKIYEAIKKEFDIDRHHSRWNTYHLADTYELPFDAILGMIERNDLLACCHPLDGAKALLDSMIKKFDIGILTSRSCFANASNKTNQWLQHHQLNHSWVEIVSSDKHKAIKRKVGRCVFFLDDCPQNLIDVLESGVSRFTGTLNYSWSKALPSEVMRFQNLHEVQSFLRGLNL